MTENIMVNFSEVAQHLSQSPIVENSLQTIAAIESDLLFSIACKKDEVRKGKRKLINGKLDVVVIGNNTNFGNIALERDFGKINFLSEDILKNEPSEKILLEALDKSLVIMTSNTFAGIGVNKLSMLYEKLPKSVFAIHDYDNHHWFGNNLQAAIFSDIYIPSHQDEFLIASRVNPNIVGGIPCGSNQWRKSLIVEKANSLNSKSRSNNPLGKYYFYEKFIHRNKAISTLSQIYPTINIVSADFHSLTEEEKWQEWSSHKVHWIIPVLNDLPIRFFDALITGGIPLIPGGLKPYIQALGIPENFYIEYGPLDLIAPKEFIGKACDEFNRLGSEGIMKRHQFAMENFHIDVILEKIVATSFKMYEVNL